MRQWFKDFIHNSIVHPILPFLPISIANKIHDANASWAFGLDRYDELSIELNKDFDVGIRLRKPTWKDVNFPVHYKTYIYKLIDKYLISLYNIEGIYRRDDISEHELNLFIDSLTPAQFKLIEEFFVKHLSIEDNND